AGGLAGVLPLGHGPVAPFGMGYWNVIARRLETRGLLRQAAGGWAIGYWRLSGRVSLRGSSRTGCSETASMQPISAPAREIFGTTPDVESVMRRLEMAIPSPSAAISSASRTASKL